jgi:ABC-type phosphate transport system auxiliary subunit
MSMMQFEVILRSLWTFLTAGSPSLMIILCAVNGIFLAIFIIARGYFHPLNYRQYVRQRIHICLAISNVSAIFHREIFPVVHDALLPFRGLLNLVI